jgi:NADH-quinone oxidoreductase subunit E
VNTLELKYAQEIENILAKYPPDQKRSAVMPLLYLAQREENYVSEQALKEIAEILEIAPTEVASIVGFYTLYYDKPGGTFRIQICTDMPCALRGSEQFMQKLCDALGVQPGETTSDGMVTVEGVMCLAACDRAPMFQVQSGEGLSYHENQTVESALKIIDQLRENAERRNGNE